MTKRRIIDIAMTVLLLFLMAYQITGEEAHEYIGAAMTLTVLVHQILNRKWYAVLFKGKYNAYRILSTTLTLLLLGSFAVTAFCGMAMSGYAVPFLYGMAPVHMARQIHLAMSHWSFVLMGLHLGVHVPAMIAGMKLNEKTKTVCRFLFACMAGFGLFLFLKAGMVEYMLFQVPFAFLDYEKSALQVFAENVLMLGGWVFLGAEAAALCQKQRGKTMPVLAAVVSIVLGLVLYLFSGGSAMEPQWSEPAEAPEKTADTTTQTAKPAGASADDGFVSITGGTFEMGSPESENWRIDDETQHTVTVSDFLIDPYETTQKDYVSLMGETAFAFTGDDLPAESISWLDAVNYANAKSIAAELTPAYTVTDSGVLWDKSADGYRLPTEAEWEYACRAGTVTPFNTEHSLSAEDANFYGHYPYEIEENYFDNSSLEARPGEYRQTTVPVGSFAANAWGLYDCHGNVNEWCWDYYGTYSTASETDPSGPESGTRHVYRGGGWNDFAKNMRSAYRAAAQADFRSYNLGVRLVRNAGSGHDGTVSAQQNETETGTGNILIAYFSWSGNTEGIAQEIQNQTGADLIEIVPVKRYSDNYNTVLMEAQEDQHNQVRPELENHVENMDNYDVILLGYPNWWASIPMPIASFLEEYDFSGKTIIPFCSHGGGRFGQSLTAIAKLAPDSVIGEGLSVHYSGGASLPEDISAWLETNGLK